MGHTHDDVARRWVQRAIHGQQSRGALASKNLFDRGDQIFSYGNHFEVGRIVRDKKRTPVMWLLNGNTFSVTTSRHQRAVREAVQGMGLPILTLPHAVLNEAGINLGLIELVDVQPDRWTSRIERREELNSGGFWRQGERYELGGWTNSLTGEFVQQADWSSTPPKQEVCDGCATPIGYPKAYGGPEWDAYVELKAVRETHVRLRHGEWERVQARHVPNGRREAYFSPNVGWDLVDEPDSPLGYVFERVIQRHWLGASLIRGAMPETIRMRCKACDATGRAAEGRAVEVWGTPGIGPLDETHARRNQDHWDRMRARLERDGEYPDDGVYREGPVIEKWNVQPTRTDWTCRACSGSGRISRTRNRWAYFLSGFDENETRPSYFFCELPRGSKPTTVTEAYEALKPVTVRLAESMGRDVKRQGDIFAIPMPGLTLRELKAQGGELVRKPKLIDRDGRTFWDGPRPRLLETNHEATEIVMLGEQTYARGTISHVPDGRRPDHKRLPLGKDWHLIRKNTVPVAA